MSGGARRVPFLTSELLAGVTHRPSQGPTIESNTQRSGQVRAHADAGGESHTDASGAKQRRQAGGQQGLADSNGKLDDGPRCSLVHTVSTQSQGEHVGGRAAVPHGITRFLTLRPARHAGGSRRTWGWGDQ